MLLCARRLCILLVCLVLPSPSQERQNDTRISGETLLQRAKASTSTIKPAAITFLTGEHIKIEYALPEGFRRGDQLLLVRSTDAGVVIVGQAEVGVVRKGETFIFMTNNLLGIELGDAVYVTNRNNSPYSISKARFVRGNATSRVARPPK